MDNTSNNAVFNNTDKKKEWPYVAYVEDYTETVLEIFFNEEKGKIFLEDSIHYGRYSSEIQELFDEKIKPELEKEEDCWASMRDEEAKLNAYEALSANAVTSIKGIANPEDLVDQVIFTIGVHSL